VRELHERTGPVAEPAGVQRDGGGGRGRGRGGDGVRRRTAGVHQEGPEKGRERGRGEDGVSEVRERQLPNVPFAAEEEPVLRGRRAGPAGRRIGAAENRRVGVVLGGHGAGGANATVDRTEPVHGGEMDGRVPRRVRGAVRAARQDGRRRPNGTDRRLSAVAEEKPRRTLGRRTTVTATAVVASDERQRRTADGIRSRVPVERRRERRDQLRYAHPRPVGGSHVLETAGRRVGGPLLRRGQTGRVHADAAHHERGGTGHHRADGPVGGVQVAAPGGLFAQDRAAATVFRRADRARAHRGRFVADAEETVQDQDAHRSEPTRQTADRGMVAVRPQGRRQTDVPTVLGGRQYRL